MTDKPFQKQTANNSGRYDETILGRYNHYFATRRDDRERYAQAVDVQICKELNEALEAQRAIAEQLLAEYSTDEDGDENGEEQEDEE
jgi:hypothetical protein